MTDAGSGPPGRGRDAPGGRGRTRRELARAGAWAWAANGGLAVALAVCYFFFPLDRLGTERPVLSWVLFLLALAALTFTLSLQVRYTVTEDPRGRPGLVIPVLVVLSLFVFSSAYYALAQYPGQMRGLTTRLDALYFTLVTTATVGYGDITPHGQEARMVAVVQIVYNFVVLAAAVTSLSGYLRTRIGSPGGRSGGTPRS